MLKIYLKQAWTLMKQNRLFSSIYVVATAVSIALTMTIFIIYYIKMAPIYPEYNRPEMMKIGSVKRCEKGNPGNWNMNMGTSYRMVKEILPSVPHITEATGCHPYIYDGFEVSRPGEAATLPVNPMFADAAFWKVFSFRFLQGKPFTEAEVDASVPVAVVSASLAQRLFAKTEVVGERMVLNGGEYRICGVVKDASNATPNSAADLYVPLWLTPDVEEDRYTPGLLGNVSAYFLVDDAKHQAEVQLAVQRAVEQVNRQDSIYQYDLMGQPEEVFMASYRLFETAADWWQDILKPILFLLVALLFIPALNLSGMISSRMDDRLSELGVRKAYGANSRQLMQQVLTENLLLTLMGCIIGLLLSYLIIYTSSDWILTLFDRYVQQSEKSVSISPEMLFNPWIFLSVSALCLLLNVVSALIPVWHALRRTIIYSLNTKR